MYSLPPITSFTAFLSESCQTPAVSSSTPGSHDQGKWEPSRVTRLPVPMLTGKKLMGVFSLLVLQRSAFIRIGTAYLDAPQNLQKEPEGIKLPA